MKNRIRQMMYSPKKSMLINQDTLRALDEVDRALEKGLAGLFSKQRKKR
jgi:hypothetical protein